MTDLRALVCFAVAHESRLFQRHVAKFANISILLTGIGRRNAERSIRAALARHRPEFVISSGFAGGLAPDLSRGTVVFDADDNFPLRAALNDSGARRVRFHCAENIVAATEAKALLWNSTGAEAVEMESQIIRQCCREANIPSATLRVISDAADEPLPIDFNQCLTPAFAFSYIKLLRILLKTPHAIPTLIRFQKNTAAANRSLCEALCGILQRLEHGCSQSNLI